MKKALPLDGLCGDYEVTWYINTVALGVPRDPAMGRYPCSQSGLAVLVQRGVLNQVHRQRTFTRRPMGGAEGRDTWMGLESLYWQARVKGTNCTLFLEQWPHQDTMLLSPGETWASSVQRAWKTPRKVRCCFPICGSSSGWYHHWMALNLSSMGDTGCKWNGESGCHGPFTLEKGAQEKRTKLAPNLKAQRVPSDLAIL